ncbi:MAG: hypothetical protein WB347_13390 [Terriglobales bacterium]
MAFRYRASLSFPPPTLTLDRASGAGFKATRDMIAKIGSARLPSARVARPTLTQDHVVCF